MATKHTLLSGLTRGLLVGGALGVALVLMLSVRRHWSSDDEWRPVPVLVSARELPAGHVLTAADLTDSTFPAPLVTPSCATAESRSTFIDRPLRWRVPPGQVLRDTDLIQPDPACAERAAAALGAIDGGTPELQALVKGLTARHGGTP